MVGCVLGALANAALVLAPGIRTLIALRVATGAALAWVYPPGMKIAAGWFERRRGTALGILIVGDGPFVAPSAEFDRSAVARVFSDRQTQLVTLGYLGHMWELYAVWTWIAAFAAAATAHRASAPPGLGSIVAFVTIASGAIGSVAAGAYADRIGKARIAGWAMVVSGACCAIAGVIFAAPLVVVLLFAIVWGVAVVADSAQLSALVAQYSPHDHVGTALTIQTCVGFLLTMASIRVLPIVAQAIGWQWTFLVLVPGPLLGALALRGLPDEEPG
jgi:MFS family permease